MSKFRYRLFQAFVILAFAVIFGRIFQLQIIDGSKLKSEAQKHQRKAKKTAFRGDIVDRHGKVLALDLSSYTLNYNPLDNGEDKETLAYKLAEITNMDELYLFKQLKKKGNRILAQNLSKGQAQAIKKFRSKQLSLTKTNRRFYPQDKLASHVVGYVDLYGKARKGVEAKYEEFLVKSQDHKISLSIDSRLQAFVEKALAEQIEKTKAERGTVIVMDTKSGEILSWAINPNYNPNYYFDEPSINTKNWSAIDVYQPGSIFKLITVAAALESKTIDKNYTFYDKGFIKVDNWKISNHEVAEGKFEPKELNIQGLFQRSSNPFAAHLALKMGANLFYKYIKAFGFGAKTNVELLGESQGIVREPFKWHKSDIASTGIGQGAISVTPLQLISAVNAIANNGTWVKPTLVKASSKMNSKKTQKKIISSSTAVAISNFLTKSIENNIKEKHSKAGNIPGLKVAGKTGTAQKAKPTGGYYRNKTTASFLGFFPAELKLDGARTTKNRNRFITLVVVDDPKTDGRWGDTVAGPLFNKVAEYCKNLYLLN